MNQTRWRELVREGRSLLLRGAQERLRLGQIAQEIEPQHDHGGARRGDGFKAAVGDLNDYAAAVDLGVETLREYRSVLLRWGGDPATVPDVSWTVLRELADVGDPRAFYDAVLRDHGKVNTVTVRIARGVPDWNHKTETPVRSKAAQARHLLADPEVAREVVEDHETRRSIHRATASFQNDNLIKNRPGFANVQREVEIAHAPFFRSLAAIGGAGFLSSLRGAAKELALLAEHDVAVPPEVMEAARTAVAEIAEHLDVLSLRAGLEEWGVRS